MLSSEQIRRWERWLYRLDRIDACGRKGKLTAAVGSTLLARLPGARLGEVVQVGPERRKAEVTGFRDSQVVLLPWGRRSELASGMEVVATCLPLTIGFSSALLGRVLDARGLPVDRGPVIRFSKRMPLNNRAPDPLLRRPVDRILPTGVRAIDGLVCLGQGQRMGLFAGPGVGKSSLLAQIARNSQADCSVICLVGERGRELNEFIGQSLGPQGLARSTVVCSTSDACAGERARALEVATSIAEGFRSEGKRVLLLVDSLTRHVRAMREVALAAGAPPGRRGFPSMVFDKLASIVERAGNDQYGSISAIYTVLTEGRVEDDPVAQEVKGLLDGHIYLSQELADMGCFPAVDPAKSLSRLMDSLVDEGHRLAARKVRLLWSVLDQRRDLIAAGAYRAGSEPLTDQAIALKPQLLEFLTQDRWSCESMSDMLALLDRMLIDA